MNLHKIGIFFLFKKSQILSSLLPSIRQNIFDPDVIRTRSLLIWSQTRYRCATESLCTNGKYFEEKKDKVLPRFELGSLDSKSRVLTITP